MEKRKAQSEITSYFQKKPRSEGQASHTIPSPENATSSSLQTERLAETVHPSGSESTHVVGMPADKVFDDVGLFVRSEIKEDEKIELMKKHFRPDQNFKFPLRQYKSRNLRFVFSWLKDFPWLVYSKAKDGGYCLPCVLFARKPDGRGCTFGVLVERPFTEFRKALGKNGVLPCHQENSFHKSAVVAFDQRMQAEENPTQGIDVLIEKQRQTQFDMNKAALGSIVECIIYLGRQGLALRGHRDDSTADPDSNRGNLQELIAFRSKTDEVLRKFLASCPLNATYLSKTIQNEIVNTLGDAVRESMISDISDDKCPFFGIIADELTDDIANKHILSLCVRFIKYDGDNNVEKIDEGILDFTYTERGTAAHLAQVIQTKLVECGLNPDKVRGQSYDTTACMASDVNGVQGLLRKDVPRAVYTPCNSHRLNLVIATASKLPQIRNSITALNDAHLFLKSSHKCQGFFENVIKILTTRDSGIKSNQKKLKGLCKTRWVERFEAIDNFIDLSSAIITTCDIIANPHLYKDDKEIKELMDQKWNWDAETKSKAQGILGQFGEFETLVSLIVNKNVLYPLREITTKLQQRDLDVKSAYSLLDTVKKDLQILRDEVEVRFDGWYEEVLALATRIGTEERMRRAKACVFRATHPAENAKEYFRRAIAIPFIDDVISQLKSHFPDESVSAISAIMSLLPCAIKTVAVGEISDIVSDLKGYEPDLPRFGNLQTELEIWRGRWFDVKDDASCPNSLISALKACSKQSFPNVHALLQIGCVIPVTSCEAERSFSTVRRVKTVLRSTMGEERLGALVLLNSRGQSNDISVGEVVQRFINQKPRRLFSPLYELA